MKNKVALVTGGFRGIGKAICEVLAANGYDLFVHGSHSSSEGEAWLNKLSINHNIKVASGFADFHIQESIDTLFQAFSNFSSRLDLLVNNAGYENCYATEDMPISDWNGVLQVNLTAPFQCSQYAARIMKKEGKGGCILNITSIHDTVPRKGYTHYCCAKAGLNMLTKNTAIEWAEYNIRVINIAAGAIETDINRAVLDSIGRDKFNEWIPLGRVGNTDDISEVILFLASDKAQYITGTTIYIDGGYMQNSIRYDDRTGK
ncbi:SDR family oxidoreductase [Providencia vermicola]|uniref:SDR family NAD(P)-dependent oxidoreductase n=1 Tax=Providencia vermicola TaxID=333965 RepID=UPI0032DB2996